MSAPVYVDVATSCRVRHSLSLSQESVVSQEHAHDCDVTVILSRYQRSGQLPPGRGPGAFEDVTVLCGADHAGVLDAVKNANDAVNAARETERKAKARVSAANAASKEAVKPS